MDLYMYISMYFGEPLFVKSARQKCRRTFYHCKASGKAGGNAGGNAASRE